MKGFAHHPALHARSGGSQPGARNSEHRAEDGAQSRHRRRRGLQCGNYGCKRHEFLGVLKYREFWLEKHNEIGLTTGLAWTEVRGSVLATEATLMEGKGRLTLTGKLGDVMQESAQAAMSYVRSRSNLLGLPRDFTARSTFTSMCRRRHPEGRTFRGHHYLHVHCKRAHQESVRRDVTMTGEITLRGKVLPSGGVKEKLLAAHRMGLRTVLLPKDNEKDLAEIPQEILSVSRCILSRHG